MKKKMKWNGRRFEEEAVTRVREREMSAWRERDFLQSDLFTERIWTYLLCSDYAEGCDI
jgi:hypothetical protein